MSKHVTIPENIAEKIRQRKPFTDSLAVGYWTKGGTYIIASNGKWRDDGKPRDLLAILPGDLGHGQVIQLYIAVAPEFVAEVERVLR